jgi:hypothetical protein
LLNGDKCIVRNSKNGDGSWVVSWSKGALGGERFLDIVWNGDVRGQKSHIDEHIPLEGYPVNLQS